MFSCMPHSVQKNIGFSLLTAVIDLVLISTFNFLLQVYISYL